MDIDVLKYNLSLTSTQRFENNASMLEFVEAYSPCRGSLKDKLHLLELEELRKLKIERP